MPHISRKNNSTSGGSSDFIDLGDVPTSYVGEGGKYLSVKVSEDGIEFTTPSGSGVTDHGALTGLSDDDHSQYHNDSRGDARYYRENEHLSTSAGAGDAGKPIVLDAAGHIDASMLNDADIDHGSIGGLSDDDHSIYIFNAPTTNARNLITGNIEDRSLLRVRRGSGGASGDADLFAVQENSAANIFSVRTIGSGDVDHIYCAWEVRIDNGKALCFYEPTASGTSYISFVAPALGSNFTYTLPNSYGTSGYFLQTDAAGGLTWAAGTGGAVDFTDLGDVPSSYTGESLKGVRVNVGETALEFYTITAVITDHGGLTGLSDDDHSQYVHTAPASSARNLVTAAGGYQSILSLKRGSGGLAANINLFDVLNNDNSHVFRVYLDEFADDRIQSSLNLWLDNRSQLRFYETASNGSNYVALRAAASLGSDLTFTLPSAYGTSGHFLQTDGSGGMTWAAGSGGVTDFTDLGDVPSSYTGESLKGVRVNVGETALEFYTITAVITDHGGLTGLSDDDHSQYHNDSRGDARYYREDEHIATSAGAGDAGKPVILDGSGHIDASMLNDADIDHGSIGGLTDDDHSIYIFNAPTTNARNLITGNIEDRSLLRVRRGSGGASGDADLFAVQENSAANIFSVRTIGSGDVDHIYCAWEVRIDNGKALCFYEPTASGTSYISFVAPALGSNFTYTLPNGYGTSGYFLQTDAAGGLTWAAGTGGVVDFTDLGDVPASYTGESLKGVRVNAGETALEFYTITAVITDHGGLTGLSDDDHTIYSLADGTRWTATPTASRAVISNGSGTLVVSSVTSTELGYVSGVTSAIQTQLDGKSSTSHNHAAGDITSGTMATARLGSGTADGTSFLRGDQSYAVPDHGSIGGLSDDDHSQYHNDSRGDARYFREDEHIATSAGAGDAGKPVILDGSGHIDASMLNDGDIDHGSVGGLSDDDHSQYHNDSRGDARYFREDEHIATSAGAGDAGKPVILDGSGHIDASMLNDGDIDHGSVGGLSDDDHSQYHNDSRGDARYYREDEHIATSAGAGDSGKPIILDAAGHIDASMINDADVDHGSIGGLSDDDHSQYHNDSRGDARYYREDEHIATSAGAGDAGKPVILDGAGHIDATMINDGDIDHGSIGGLSDDDHSQYHNDSRGDARYYRENEHLSTSAGAGDAGKPVILDGSGHIDASMLNDADIDHGSIGGLSDDDHSQYSLADGTRWTATPTASRAVISNGSGTLVVSSVTSTEIGYVSGVTSAIQTQLDGKSSTSHVHAVSSVLISFISPHSGSPPATLYAQLDFVVGTSTPAENIPVAAFDAGADEYMDFYLRMPEFYNSGGIDVDIHHGAASATTNTAIIGIAIRRIDDSGEDLDTSSHSYDFNTSNTTPPGTVGQKKVTTIAFTDGADMDSLAAGEMFVLRIYRDADNGSDNMAGDFFLYGLSIKES